MRATFPPLRVTARTHARVWLMCLTLPWLLAGCQVAPASLLSLHTWGTSSAVAAPLANRMPKSTPVEAIIVPVGVPRIAHLPMPEAVPDHWAEIRASFALDHALEQRAVQQELRWLKRHPSYLPQLQARLQRYLPYIHAQVVERGLPGELTLLPIVESALDPYAFSHGGAAGLWQFIPGTAKRFGLTRDWWVDDRRDPVLATDAALDYLEYLHGYLDDWYLAVAGYNAGEGNVRRALKKAHGDTSFWVLDLPRETSAYVPRLLALAAVVDNPEAHGLSLPALVPGETFATVNTHGQFDLTKAAQALELPVDVLYDWNPALNQWATPPAGPHRLHVPMNLADIAQARIDAVPEKERVQWLRVEVANGDTLSHIARRYRTDVATLQRVNRLSGSTIRAGQALFIPKSREAPELYPTASRLPKGDYQVKPGDSLWSIARAHGVALNSLVKVNHIGPKEVLRVGQSLEIPGATRSRSAAGQMGRGDVIRKVRYGVRRGDSLAKIATKFNVGISDLAQWNRLDIKNYLQPGQKLLIYVNVAAAE